MALYLYKEESLLQFRIHYVVKSLNYNSVNCKIEKDGAFSLLMD